LVGLLFIILLASWFLPTVVPNSAHQFDFWLVWLACMLLLALPLTLLEIALSKRNQTAPLQALSSLTREADIKPMWRGIGWMAAAVMALLSGGLLLHAGQNLQQLAALQSVSSYLPAIVMLAGLALSLVPRFILLLIAVLSVLLASVLNMLHADFAIWHWTAFSFKEWAGAVALAVASTGVGYGVYWQIANQAPTNSANNNSQTQSSSIALPIVLAQAAGGVVFALSQTTPNQTSLVLFAVSLLTSGAFLIALLRDQLQARGLAVVIQWAVVVAGVAIWLLPMTTALTTITLILALVTSLLYAIFAGWLMKISHLRKALNFQHEALYNLWRVAVRLVVPLAILLAVIGVLLPN
jgi:hypothetical protein